MILSVEMKEGICKRLVGYDKDIVEIIQFGSSVYAPEYARDVDLLVITRRKKEYGGYLDCLDELGMDFDVVVKEEGEVLRSDFACQILGAFEILHGDGRYLAEITKDFDPSYEEAKSHLRRAREYLELAKRSADEYDKDGHIRTAFNELFHGSRVAAMVYLSMENTRWGQIKRRLPRHYRDEFEEFINVLHIDYFYNGNYPANYEEEFEKWYKRVEEFVSELEEKSGR